MRILLLVPLLVSASWAQMNMAIVGTAAAPSGSVSIASLTATSSSGSSISVSLNAPIPAGDRVFLFAWSDNSSSTLSSCSDANGGSDVFSKDLTYSPAPAFYISAPVSTTLASASSVTCATGGGYADWYLQLLDIHPGGSGIDTTTAAISGVSGYVTTTTTGAYTTGYNDICIGMINTLSNVSLTDATGYTQLSPTSFYSGAFAWKLVSTGGDAVRTATQAGSNGYYFLQCYR